jgi:exonuclease VII small subunit
MRRLAFQNGMDHLEQGKKELQQRVELMDKLEIVCLIP